MAASVVALALLHPDLALTALASGLSGAMPALMRLAVDATRHRFKRGVRVVEIAAEERSVTVEDVVDASDNDLKRELAFETIEAAMYTSLDAKVVALGKALAEGLFAEHDEVTAVERYFVQSLARLELPHLRVLDILSRDIHFQGSVMSPLIAGWEAGAIGTKLPGYTPIIPQIIAVLVSEGLAQAVPPLLDSPSQMGTQFNATQAGHQMLRRLRAAGLEDSDEVGPDAPDAPSPA